MYHSHIHLCSWFLVFLWRWVHYFKQTGFICDNVQKKIVENICNPSKSYVHIQFGEALF